MDSPIDASVSNERKTLEDLLVSLYRTLLQSDQLDEHSSFYQHGGTSLSATMLLADLLSQHGLKVSFDEFDKHNTPAGLAAKLHGRRGVGGVPAFERHASFQRDTFPLSAPQRSRSWYLSGFRGDRLADDGMYNSGYVAILEGRIDADSFERAFGIVASRHDALGMTYTLDDGRAVQTHGGRRGAELHVAEAPADLLDACKAALAAGQPLDHPFVQEFVHSPFDWSKGEALRARLLRADETLHLLLLAGNHIAFDFMSRSVFLRDLSQVYEALVDDHPRRSGRPPQYRDYLAWEDHYQDSPAYSEDLSYWIKYLSGSEQDVTVPVTVPRSEARVQQQEPYHQGKLHFTLDRALTDRVKTTAKALGVTPFALLFTAFAATLRESSGSDRATIGTQIANRRHKELLETCGCFAQPVALVSALSGATTIEAAARTVQKDVGAAIEHQPVALPAICEAMQRRGHARRHPLYQCTFEYFDEPPSALALPGVEVRDLFLPYYFGRTSHELMLLLWEHHEGTRGVVLYAKELHTDSAADALAATFVRAAQQVADAPQATIDQLTRTIAEQGRTS